jgi:hypothetical protein
MTGSAVVEVAESLLRAGAARGVRLRLGAPAIANAVTEQLGLETPEFNDQELWPVVVRAASGTALGMRELLVSAKTVAVVAGDVDVSAGELLLRDAAGVLLGEEFFRIVAVTAEMTDGVAYCYRVQVERAQ